MKIALISPNPHNLQQMGRVLEASAHIVVLVNGGKTRMRAVAEDEQPDLMVVEGMCCDPAELTQVEYITTHHPQVAVILLCATQTPEFLINAMRAGVREVLPSPASSEALQAAVNRIATKLGAGAARTQGKIFAFLSCKGGSGATFLATNLACQLAQTKSVLLIDLNLQFGDALSFVHDGKPALTLADVARDIRRMDASFLAASTVRIMPNFSLLAAPEDPAQAMEIKPEHIEAILNLAVTRYDFILLDMPRNLDTLAIRALDRANRIFPVMQAGLPSIRNAARLLSVFRSLNYAPEKIEVIVNRHERSGDIGLDDIRRTLGDISLHAVPNSYKEVTASVNQGSPLMELARSNSVTRNLAEFALSLNPAAEESRGLFGRLFKWG